MLPPPHPACWDPLPKSSPPYLSRLATQGLVHGLQQLLGPAPRGRSRVTTVMPNGSCVVHGQGGHGGVNRLAGVLFYFKVACQFIECERAM